MPSELVNSLHSRLKLVGDLSNLAEGGTGILMWNFKSLKDKVAILKKLVRMNESWSSGLGVREETGRSS